MSNQIPQEAQNNGRIVYIPMTKRQIDELMTPETQPVLQAQQDKTNLKMSIDDIKKFLDSDIVKKVEKSILESIFVVEDGVISFSLRAMSIIFSLLLTGVLAYSAKLYCD